MNISELSIRRPVLATVLTIIILLFGLIGYNTLGVREYPSNKDNAVSQWNLNYPSIWKLPPMTYATKCPAHNVTCHATVTLLLYPRLMPMQRLS